MLKVGDRVYVANREIIGSPGYLGTILKITGDLMQVNQIIIQNIGISSNQVGFWSIESALKVFVLCA